MKVGKNGFYGTIIILLCRTVHHLFFLPCPAVGTGAIAIENKHLPTRSTLILLVADLLHPIDGLAIEPLLNGDMCHGGG